MDDKKIADEFADIMDAANEAKKANLGFIGFIKRKQYRPQLFWSVVFMCCQQFTGMNAIMVWMPLHSLAPMPDYPRDCLLAAAPCSMPVWSLLDSSLQAYAPKVQPS